MYALHGRYILSFHTAKPTIIENGTVLVEDSKIVEVGVDLDTTGYEDIHFPHHVLMPGLINAHSHAAMTLFRGYADDVSLSVWLNDYIWPLEAKLTPDQVKIGAKLSAVEMINSGSTTMNSMYWHPDAEASAFEEMGVRLLVGPPIISGVNTLDTYKHLVDDWHGRQDDLIRIALNPHAPYTVTAEEYQQIHDFQGQYNASASIPLQVHTHLAEDVNEMSLIRSFAEKQGFSIPSSVETPTQYFASLGILNEHLIAAHVVECSEKDISLLGENKVGVSVNPVSNMKLGHNTPHVDKLLASGAVVGLGTDGPASNNSLNMFETMKMTTLLNKSRKNDASALPADQVLRMATYGGAQALGWDNLGGIAPGMYADIIAIDLKKPYLRPVTSPGSILSLLVYSVHPHDVSDVMIHGKWKKRHNQIVDIDLDGLIKEFDDTVSQIITE